jgi:predicted hydrocarbon binding protein
LTKLTRTKRRLFPMYFAPGKKLFQIVVRLSDAPGSYSTILNLLGSRVNLVGTITYSMSDGTAVFNAIAESLSPKETTETLDKLIMSSKAAMESMVMEGHEGLIVDTFHVGTEIGGEGFMLMRTEGLSGMFDAVARMLGSGGETLLFNEGRSLGENDTEKMIDILGKEVVTNQSQYLQNYLASQGWGKVTTKLTPGKMDAIFMVEDCFECSGDIHKRRECSFVRGYIEGSSGLVWGQPVAVTETKCFARGDPACEFRIKAKSGK